MKTTNVTQTVKRQNGQKAQSECLTPRQLTKERDPYI